MGGVALISVGGVVKSKIAGDDGAATLPTHTVYNTRARLSSSATSFDLPYFCKKALPKPFVGQLGMICAIE